MSVISPVFCFCCVSVFKSEKDISKLSFPVHNSIRHIIICTGKNTSTQYPKPFNANSEYINELSAPILNPFINKETHGTGKPTAQRPKIRLSNTPDKLTASCRKNMCNSVCPVKEDM